MIEFEHKSATDGPIIIIIPQSASKSKYWTRVAIFPNRMRKNARPNGSFEKEVCVDKCKWHICIYVRVQVHLTHLALSIYTIIEGSIPPPSPLLFINTTKKILLTHYTLCLFVYLISFQRYISQINKIKIKIIKT